MHTIFLTGAGLSEPSGIQTFRSPGGRWANMSDEQFKRVAFAASLATNYDEAIAFYDQRRQAIEAAQPNSAHAWLSGYLHRYPATLFTQNVDGLDRLAGSDVVELHGRLCEVRCLSCGSVYDIGFSPCAGRVCQNCHGLLRPAVVMFDDDSPAYRRLDRARRQATNQDAFVVIGTSGAVVPASLYAHVHPGLRVLNIAEPSDKIDPAAFDVVIYQSCLEAVHRIEAALDAWRNHPGDREAAKRAAG